MAHGPIGPWSSQDHAIFAQLQLDGRMPYTALGERVGLSEAQVRRRVRQLTDSDMFQITAVADPRLIGLECMAWIGFVTKPAATETLARSLSRTPGVDYVVISSGRFNVMAEVACRSTAELDSILIALRSLEGVQMTETFMFLSLARQQFQWAGANGLDAATAKPVAITGARPDLEPIDIAIVAALERDGRASFRDVARQLGASERVVSSRFTQLVENKVLKVMAVGNPLNLGFNAMALLGVTATTSAARDALVTALGQIPAVDYVVVASGPYDVLAELVCRDVDHLLKTLAEDVGAISEIAYVETFYYMRLLYPSTAGAWGVGRTLARREEPWPNVGMSPTSARLRESA